MWFEEFFGNCPRGSQDKVDKKLLRRVMDQIVCSYHCAKCMPQYFSNPFEHLVVYRLNENSKIKDPLDEDYNAFIAEKYKIIQRVDYNANAVTEKEFDKLGDQIAEFVVTGKLPVEDPLYDDANSNRAQ